MVTPRASNYTSARNEPPQGLNFSIYQIQPKVYLGKQTKKYSLFCPIGRQTILLKYENSAEMVVKIIIDRNLNQG